MIYIEEITKLQLYFTMTIGLYEWGRIC